MNSQNGINITGHLDHKTTFVQTIVDLYFCYFFFQKMNKYEINPSMSIVYNGYIEFKNLNCIICGSKTPTS